MKILQTLMQLKLNRIEKSWLLYDVACSAYSFVVITAIMPVFFKNFAAKDITPAISTAYWGYANSIAALIVAFSAPVLGAMADYRGCKKLFLGAFCIVGVIATFALTLIGEGEWLKALIIFMISVIGFSCANVFYDAFLVDITEDERMDAVSSYSYAWGYIGSIAPFLLVSGLIIYGGSCGIQTLMTKIGFAITGIWWIIFAIPLFKNVKQTHFVERTLHPISDALRRLFDTLKNIKNHKNILLFILAYFFYIDGVGTIIRMAIPYAQDLGLSTTELMIIILAIQFVAFPFAILYGRLADFFSAKTMIFVGIIVYFLITFIGFLMPSFEDRSIRLMLFWGMAMLLATSQGGIQGLSRSFFGKIIPKEKSAEFFGFYNIFGKFAAIIGPALMSIMIEISGESRYGILSIAVLFLIGALILLYVEDVKDDPESAEDLPRL